MDTDSDTDDFDCFVREAEPRLRRAYGGHLAPHRVGDAVGSALEYAWTNWDRVALMEHPVGYLFRVGLSKSRSRKQARLPTPPPNEMPQVEPALIRAVQQLPRRQREVVWLVEACEWTPTEAARALGVSLSAIRTHRSRGLERLRRQLGVKANA
ncbi:MAG: RNA polymerase sigma factor [Ilumatobacter sp.]|uniref:RNA polymerase sigma factor n=1 Tax=Ilumatobacter sp. TaxID=1967498 RepID=UPI00391ABB79